MESKRNNTNNILVIKLKEKSVVDHLLFFSIGMLLGLVFSSSNINCNSDDDSDDDSDDESDDS